MLYLNCRGREKKAILNKARDQEREIALTKLIAIWAETQEKKMAAKTVRLIFIFLFLSILTCPLYAQNKICYKELIPLTQLAANLTPNKIPIKISVAIQNNKEITNPYFDFINKNSNINQAEERDEKKILREKWKELLQIDIFYPYFKAKEVEDWVSGKFKCKVFKIKGRPKFEDNQIKYIFKTHF